MGMLKNMEMHYRSTFSKIIHTLNLSEDGIFKAAFEVGCPNITTNFMIYVPCDDLEDGNCDIFEQ